MTLIVYILYTDQDLKVGYIHASKRKKILYFSTANWCAALQFKPRLLAKTFAGNTPDGYKRRSRSGLSCLGCITEIPAIMGSRV